MIHDRIGYGAVDYCLYRIGNSKQEYRGPEPDFGKPYCAFIGGSETYGKFLEKPFPQLLADRLGIQAANFGGVNNGVDQYSKDPVIQVACAGAVVAVVAVMGAHNLSNRFYTVHPRRNDRFVQASAMLQNLFREVDFSEINFTRHLLQTLHETDADRFAWVVAELKAAWVARMKLLVELIPHKTILFWMADHLPDDALDLDVDQALARDPMFVDQHMIDQLSPKVARVVECVPSRKALRAGTKGMVFTKDEAAAARQMFGQRAHKEAANVLETAIGGLLK